MSNIDPSLRPLKEKPRRFVDLMISQGLSRQEAYVMVYGDDEEASSKSNSLFNRPNVLQYYYARLDELKEKESSKAVWTREVATKKLVSLIEKAEQEMEQGKPLTMSRLQAIVLPAKELNLMNGFNQTNLNVEGCVVQIVGEQEIPE